MAAGFVVAALGGLTFSDCFLCTLTELLSVWGGTLLFLVGATTWQRRQRRSASARIGIVVVATVSAFAAAVAARLLITSVATGGI